MLVITLVLMLMGQTAKSQAPVKSPAGLYQVAFWYNADQPVESLKYQVYDVSKGEYDARAVDRWATSILRNDPAHGAYIREIKTEGFPGATEKERLERAIQDEKARWAALQRKFTPELPRVTEPLRLPVSGPVPARSLPGGSRGEAPLPSSPFPYPYRSGPR